MNVFQLIAVYFSYPFVRYAFIAEGETACGKLRFDLRMPAYVLGRICHS